MTAEIEKECQGCKWLEIYNNKWICNNLSECDKRKRGPLMTTEIEKGLFEEYGCEPKRIFRDAETQLYNLAKKYNVEIRYYDISDSYYIEVFKISPEKVLKLIQIIQKYAERKIKDEIVFKSDIDFVEQICTFLIRANKYLTPQECNEVKEILEN